MGIVVPRTGGHYIWATRFVDPFVGWFGNGWMYFLVQIFSIGLIGSVLTGIIPGIFSIIGGAAGIPMLTSTATALETNTFLQGVVVVAVIVILGLVALIEIKHYIKVVAVIWGLNLLGLIVSVILFATNNPTTIPAAWNNVWGAGSYQTIVSLATKYNLAGYVASTSGGWFNDTLSIIVYLFWALTGYEINTVVSGEVKNPRSSFLYWYTGGMIGTIIWYTIVTWLAYNTYGGFILQYSYVYNLFQAGKLAANETAAVTPYMQLPSMPLFAASLAGSAAVRIIAAWWFWPVTSIIVTYLCATRAMFGMAFDRMFPAVFGKVNDRTHTPVQSTLFTTIASVVVALVMFTSYGYLESAANTTFLDAFVYFLICLPAVVLAYKRRDLWERGTRKKIFGIPDTTFIGGLAALGMFWIVTLSTIGINLLAWNVTMLWLVVGVIIFFYYAAKNERRGINITQIYGEIPPP
jgi:amino acid transporter